MVIRSLAGGRMSNTVEVPRRRTLRDLFHDRRQTALLVAIVAAFAVRPVIGDTGAAPAGGRADEPESSARDEQRSALGADLAVRRTRTMTVSELGPGRFGADLTRAACSC